MANVKLSEKKLLEQLQAKITLLNGKKVSQQELLDKCIKFSDRNFEKFTQDEFYEPRLTPEKIKLILEDTVDTGYNHPEKSDDELIYGL